MSVTDEHERILRAVEALENALRDRASRRTRAWRQRLLRHLMRVHECLREHSTAAEGRGGTLADVETNIGRLPEVTIARREHLELMALAANLVAATERGHDAARLPTHERDRGAMFADALRRHLLADIDLLQIRCTLDVGVVD